MHNAHCARHNWIVEKLNQLLHKNSLRTCAEPILPTNTTVIKPDLVVQKEHQMYIVVISIVSGFSLTETWDLKIQKYGT